MDKHPRSQRMWGARINEFHMLWRPVFSIKHLDVQITTILPHLTFQLEEMFDQQALIWKGQDMDYQPQDPGQSHFISAVAALT